MAYTFSTANTPGTGAIAMYLLKTTLVTAGWLVMADSDGSTYNAAGGQVTTGVTGAGGLGNSNAWIRLQSPTVGSNTREITIQRGSTDLLWRIKYSANANFTGGTPGMSQTASSTDEVYMSGGGTDASPTFTSLFPTNNTYRWHICAGGAAEFYSFYAYSLTSTTTSIQNNIALDVMAAGTYPTQDIDPAVMLCFNSGSVPVNSITSNVTGPAQARAWLGPVSVAGSSLLTNNVNVGLDRFAGNLGVSSFAVNPFSSKDTLWTPIYFAANTNSARGPLGAKGASTLFKLGSMARTNLDTITTAGAQDHIYLGGLWLPWDGTTPVA